MDGPYVGSEGTISSLLHNIWLVWLSGQAMVNVIVQAHRMNGGMQGTISSVLKVILTIIQFLMTVWQAWLSGQAMVNLFVHAYGIDAPYVSIGNQETISSLLQVILAIVQFLNDMWQAWINGQSMGQIAMQASWNIAIITDALIAHEARRQIP